LQENIVRIASFYQSRSVRRPARDWPVVGRHGPKFAARYQSDVTRTPRNEPLTLNKWRQSPFPSE
jgi:hypothetical protein